MDKEKKNKNKSLDDDVKVLKNANVFASDKFGKEILTHLKSKGVQSGKYIFLNNKTKEEKLNKCILESFINFYCFDFNLDSNIDIIKKLSKVITENNKILIAMALLPETKNKVKLEEFKNKIIELKKIFNTIIVIDLNHLKKTMRNLPKKELIEVTYNLIIITIKGLVEIVVTPQFVGIHYTYIDMIFKNGNITSISLSSSDSDNRVKELVEETFLNILLDCNLTKKTDCIIHISGSNDLSLEEIDNCGQNISKLLPETSNVVWGARNEENLRRKVIIFTIFTGVEFK